MEVYFPKWKLFQELLAKEHHPSNPEEKDIMSCFQQCSWIKCSKIICLKKKQALQKDEYNCIIYMWTLEQMTHYLIWPAKYGKWKQAWGKPCIEDIFILLQCDLWTWNSKFLGCLIQCFFSATSTDPVFIISLLRKVGWEIHLNKKLQGLKINLVKI